MNATVLLSILFTVAVLLVLLSILFMARELKQAPTRQRADDTPGFNRVLDEMERK